MNSLLKEEKENNAHIKQAKKEAREAEHQAKRAKEEARHAKKQADLAREERLCLEDEQKPAATQSGGTTDAGEVAKPATTLPTVIPPDRRNWDDRTPLYYHWADKFDDKQFKNTMNDDPYLDRLIARYWHNEANKVGTFPTSSRVTSLGSWHVSCPDNNAYHQDHCTDILGPTPPHNQLLSKKGDDLDGNIASFKACMPKKVSGLYRDSASI